MGVLLELLSPEVIDSARESSKLCEKAIKKHVSTANRAVSTWKNSGTVTKDVKDMDNRER